MSTSTISFDPTLHPTATVTAGTGSATVGGGKLATFEGFLKAAGHLVGVVLADIVKYVVPIAQVVTIVDPAAAPVLAAFTTSLELVQNTVVSAQQRWVSEGSAANTQKLADVLLVVEAPITLLFAQAGVAVDTGYVTNLVNGVVAILNAQPGNVLAAVATKQNN